MVSRHNISGLNPTQISLIFSTCVCKFIIDKDNPQKHLRVYKELVFQVDIPKMD